MSKFPKTARLLKKRDYQRVLRAGHRVVGELLLIDHRRGPSSSPRLGITVSRRYGKAHDRNRFKRVVREAFRQSCPFFPKNLEINVVPRRPFFSITTRAVLEELSPFYAQCSATESR